MPNVTCQKCNTAIINVPAEKIGKGMTVTCPVCHMQTDTLPSAEDVILLRLERIDRKVGFIYLTMRIFVGLAVLCAAMSVLIIAIQIWVSSQG
jgi:hypothetical protein